MLCSKAFVCALGLGALADAQLSLGTASGYGVFAASTITNTGLTTVGARIGLSPGSSITGFLPGINLGEDIDNAAAVQAKADIQSLYNALVAMPATTVLTGQDLGGQTLDAGVYSFASSGGLTGILTLDGQGDPNAVFVFQFGSTLTTATAAAVVLINGAQACNVYWQVGSSATLGTATVFAGIVVAEASITVTTGTSLLGGGFYALTAAVTLDTNIIDPLGACGLASPPAPTSTSTTATTPTAISTTAPPATVTTTTTSTLTVPASTTTITVSDTVTVTQTVATSTTTCHSTTTKVSTHSTTKTASATACPKKSALEARGRGHPITKTKTETTECAGHTHTMRPSSTHTVKATCTSTSTIWHTQSSTTTWTSTKRPACTTHAKAKREHARALE
ncbi:hypothetical protein B0A55_05837 [Friedmanniomyces simplex]|uniref:Ice-binding protein n=1 Tax=Friedmanniomyces simplex TaxID=329884 RepID=A0A4U0XK77_9PEZI|nr:hypothetical protein B0A55_05837 [Friedmanniomyces simplex]